MCVNPLRLWAATFSQKNFGQWGLLFGNLGMDLPARDPLAQPVVLCGVSLLLWCGVVWCVGAVCVQNFRGCLQDLGRFP